MKKILSYFLVFLLVVGLGFTSFSLSEKKSKERLGKLLRNLNWVQKLTKAYFRSELSKDKMVLFLEQKLEDHFSQPQPKVAYVATSLRYKQTLKEMKRAVKKDQWTALYKKLKVLKTLKGDFLEASFKLIFSNN